MLKQVIVLEVVKSEKVFKLELPTTTYGELYDVLTEMRQFVINKINEENEAKKEQPKEEPPVEAVKET